jgi:hypothetical protein
MAGRILPASRLRNPQEHRSSAAPVLSSASVHVTPIWRTGDKVFWNGYMGTFLRETLDDYAEVLIGIRTYRLAKAELR